MTERAGGEPAYLLRNIRGWVELFPTQTPCRRLCQYYTITFSIFAGQLSAFSVK